MPEWAGDVWKMAKVCRSPLLDTKKFLPDTTASLKYHSTFIKLQNILVEI
jgi:hypothetical protein